MEDGLCDVTCSSFSFSKAACVESACLYSFSPGSGSDTDRPDRFTMEREV